MKMLLASIMILGTVSAFADNRVQIEIKADSKELCSEAAKSATLANVEEEMRSKHDIRIVEITNCNRTLTGKYIKTVKFEKLND
ncbi:MAG: hypothetical protein ACJ76H_04795 [Bacteriovoracaceae bacterium]